MVLGGWPAVTGRVFGDLSSRVQSLISSGRPTCPNRMDTDQLTSEKMQRPGEYSSSSPHGATTDERPMLSQSVNSRDHRQCAMLFRRYVSRTAAGSGRAVLEGVGLTHETIEMCYTNLPQNEEEAIQLGLMKWRNGSGISRTWAVLIEAMEYAQIGTQHIEAMKKELLKDLPRKRQRLSTQSSEDLELQEPVAKKLLHDYTALKSDHLVRDISDLHLESDPEVVIKLLYGNALATISDLLEPHLKEVKKAAVRYHRLGLHHVSVGEDIIESADSIDSLMSRMSVGGMWDQTRFLRKAITSIPQSASDRKVAEAILFHYDQHLAIYKRATLLKDAIPKEPQTEEEAKVPLESTELVPLKITSQKDFDSFSYEDCYILQVRGLKKAFGIPEGKIIFRKAEDGHSTTVTFMIPRQYVHDVIQHSGQLDAVWILLELDIIEVSIPGVFTFIPSVGCFLSLLRGSKPFTADLLGVTEVLPYQTYCLLDPNTKEPLSGRPLSTKRIEQHWDSHGDLVPDLHGPVPESGDIEIPDTHSEEAVIPPKGSDVSATDEWQSKVGELEDKVKDLERKVANLFMDNVALKTKLEASREVERQQYEEIARLKERLVQALSAQDTATQEQSLSRTRESELKEEIKVLEEVRSDLEAEVEKLQKHMKQLEILPSDIEQFAKSVVPGQVTGGPTAVEDLELARIREEATKGSSGETSAVPGQVTGGPTAATRGSQPPTQVSGRPPVVEAARLGQLSTVRKLLDSGTATVEDRDEGGMTALLWASLKGHLPVVRELVNVYKVNVFQKSKNGRNAMHKAAQGGSLNVIKFLLPMFRARVYEKDAYSYSMLHCAAQGGHCQVARYLITELKLDPQDRDKWGNTALLKAAYGGSVSLVRMLLEEYGSSVDEVNKWGYTALLRAAYGGRAEVVRMLMDCGSNVDEVTNKGWTAVLEAAANGHLALVRELVEQRRADLLHRSNDGVNALHLAAVNGHLDLVKYLVPRFGQHRFDEDSDGETCLDLAIGNEKHNVVEYLQQEGGFSDQQ